MQICTNLHLILVNFFEACKFASAKLTDIFHATLMSNIGSFTRILPVFKPLPSLRDVGYVSKERGGYENGRGEP